MEARYYDGLDASVHSVQLSIENNTLTVAGGTVQVLWHLAQVYIIDGGDKGHPLRLGCRSAPDARLTIADAYAIDTLKAALPQSARNTIPPRRLAVMIAAGTTGLSLAILFALNFVSLVTGLIPISVEERLGVNVRNQIVALFEMGSKGRAPICNEHNGAAILEQLTQRLLSGIDTPLTFRVEMIRAPMVNAVSLPGGRILIFNELIEKANNGDEVAGVLAHEIAHNLQRHSIQALVRQQGIGIVLGALTGYSGNNFASFGKTLLTLSFSREAENEADLIATELLMNAGLRTTGLASFFARLGEKETGSKLSGFTGYFASHPPPGERAKRAHSYGTGGQPALSEVEFIVLRHMCD